MYKPIRKADLIIGGTAVKQGEIFTLGFQLFDANGLVIVPTVGQTITVKVANKTGVVFETTAVVVGDHIEFTVAENIGAGKMRVELTVADGANVLQKYPANGYIELYITASLDDIGTGTIYTVTAAEMFTRIEGSEEASASAVQTAGEAVVIAETAVETADAVRADFDLVVAEAGSSNPEVVLARGGEADLSTRLNGVDSQLADMGYNMSGLNGTGLIDDSATIQSIITSAVNNKVKKITFPQATYRIDNRIYITGNDIDIDFSGSTILSYAKANSNVWGELGLFNIHGSIVGGEIITYMRTAYTVPNPPAESPLLLTYEKVAEGGGRVNTSNNAYFSVGDYAFLRGWTRATGAPYDATLYEPELIVLAKITKVADGYLYVDYSSPYTFTGFVQSATLKSVAIKCIPLKNVKLKNFKVVDKTILQVGGASPTSTDSSESISMVSPILCDNVTIENIEVEDHRANAINPFYSRDVKIKNIIAKNARMWSGGDGYLTQIRGCTNISVDNVLGIKCRHVVDFSFSHYGKVTNAKGIDGYSYDFDLHGLCEHDIVFERCQGSLQLTNNIVYFPNMCENVSVKDSKIYLTASSDSYIKNLYVENSDISIPVSPYAIHFNFSNSNIKWHYSGSSSVVNKRGQNITARGVFDNCGVELLNPLMNQAYTLSLSGYDELVFEDINFKWGFDPMAYTSIPTLTLINAGKIHLNNVQWNQLRISLTNTLHPIIVLIVKNSKFEYVGQSGGAFLAPGRLENCRFDVNISDSVFMSSGVLATNILSLTTTNKLNATVLLNVHDNKILGASADNIGFTYPGTNNASTLTTYMIDHNNFIKNQVSTSKLSVTKNVILT